MADREPPAAGWYPDPDEGPDEAPMLRYFDGEEWTDQYKSAPTKRAFPVWLRVALGVIAVLVGLALLGVIDTDKLIHRIKGGRDTAEIATFVRDGMREQFRTDPDLAPLRLKVTNVDVVHSSGNDYRGIATVLTPKGSSHDVLVDITADGETVLWSAPPGSFAFAYFE